MPQTAGFTVAAPLSLLCVLILSLSPTFSHATNSTPSNTTSISSTNAPLDHTLALVWGPGLRPDHIVLPARYFYIQASRTDGTAYTLPLDQPYDIHIQGKSRRYGHCRVHSQQIDRGDGSVLVRYKLLDECTDFAIHIRHGGTVVAASPYRLPGGPSTVVRSALCTCRRPLDVWLQQNACPTEHPQITADLRPFAAVNASAVRGQLLQRFGASPGSVSLCHYAIRAGRIRSQCFGQHTGFRMFVDAVLVALGRQVRLPDTELFANLGDWPLIKRGGQTRTAGPLPVFSWCGSADSFDIVWPTYDLTESALQSMGRVMLDMQSVQAVRWPWSSKRPQAFWRGRDSRRERLQLMDVAREASVADLFNVSMTNFFFFRDEEERYGPRSAHMSFMEFFEYKWQICIDGTVAAYRLPYLLGGDSLVLKQQSPFYEHFYGQLVAGEHYVAVRRDLRDLVERVRWARDSDEQAQRIVRNAQRFARENLQADHVLCYHALLLKKWSERLVAEVRDDWDGMETVEVEANDCDCPDGGDLVAGHDEL